MAAAFSSRTTLIGIGLCVALAINSFVAVRAVRVLIGNEQRVSQTNLFIHELERLLSLLKDAETGARGFVITGKETFLEPYDTAVVHLPRQIDLCNQLIAGDAEATPMSAELNEGIQRRMALLRDAIEFRKSRGFGPVQAQIAEGAGKAEMDHLRAVVDAMQNTQRRVLLLRAEQSRRSIRNTFVTFGLATLVNLILIALAYRLLKRERAAKARSERMAGTLQKLQTVSDAALATLPTDALLRQMLQRLQAALGSDTAMGLLLGADGQLHLRAAVGIEEEERSSVPVPVGSGFDGRIAAERQPLVFVDITQQAIVSPVLRRHIRSVAGVPMIVEGRLIGVLHVGRRRVEAFVADDISALQMAADRMALAIERAQALEQERDAVSKLQMKTEQVERLNAELESRVRRRTIDLENANKELEAFSYSVSHDLRAPLRTLDGFSQAVLEDYASVLDDMGKDYLRRIRAASQRMGELIDALLQLSRVTRSELVVSDVDVAEIARGLVTDMKFASERRTVNFVVPDQLRVRGDAGLLRVALQNLLDNAWKFTAGRSDAMVQIDKLNGHGNGNGFFVRDNGAGFDMQYSHKLFHAFQRLHGDAQFRGSGIGLATVQRIVRRHGGRIWAKGAVNEGATFYVELGT